VTGGEDAQVSPEAPGRETDGLDDDVVLRAGLEAILFLADEPVATSVLSEALDVPEERVEAELEGLARRHTEERRGTEVRRAAGGWRMYSSPLARAAIERWAVAGRTGRLTQAALETLAVIAYKQPIGRQEIGDVRGVNADAAVRTLVARGLVTEVGRHAGPGQAVLYGTTTTFLERLGLDSLDELPPLTDYLPEAPAPDEPDLGALRDVRRRLARGDDSALDGQEAAAGDDELLPAPGSQRRRGEDAAGMDPLSDELARGAVDRLRQAVAAAEDPPPATRAADDGPPAEPPQAEPPADPQQVEPAADASEAGEAGRG